MAEFSHARHEPTGKTDGPVPAAGRRWVILG
jgi:hypothetical protein